MVSDQPLLSVIITTYSDSRLADVFDLLWSLKRQSYPHIEVLFVGERATDLCQRVKEYAEEQGIANVTVLSNDGEPGLSAARNVAIPHARGQFAAFLDDDVVAFPNWAEAVVRAVAETDAIGVTGPALPLWDDPSMAWLPEELYWVISCTGWSGWDQVREVRNAWGMNMAFRREAFQSAGHFCEDSGYHKGPFAEDIEFSLRVQSKTGKRILYTPHARVWHKVHPYRLSWHFIRERAYWIGRSRRNLLRSYGGDYGSGKLLGQEGKLLGKILTRRIPAEVASLLRNPRVAWRRLSVTLWALFFVAAGYYADLVPGRKRAVSLETRR